jgi:hypothetical protein
MTGMAEFQRLCRAKAHSRREKALGEGRVALLA